MKLGLKEKKIFQLEAIVTLRLITEEDWNKNKNIFLVQITMENAYDNIAKQDVWNVKEIETTM